MTHANNHKGLYLSVQPLLENTLDRWSREIWDLLPRTQKNEAYVAKICSSQAPLSVINGRMSALLCFLRLLQEVMPQTLASTELGRDNHGRPFAMLSDTSLPVLDFNLTHSRAFVGCALLVGDGRVGIDIEEIMTERLATRLPSRFFSPAEQARLENETTADGRAWEATRIWTVKEAVSKQDGQGFPVGFDSLSLPADISLYHGSLNTPSPAVLTVCVPADCPPPVLGKASLPLTLIPVKR